MSSKAQVKPEILKQLVGEADGCFRKGEWTQALARLAEIIRIDPNMPWAHAIQAETLVKLGRLEEAEQAYRNALLLKPDWVPVNFNYANLLERIGRFDEAVALYDKVLGADPGHKKAWMQQAIALSQMGCKEEAVGLFQSLLERYPEYTEARINLSRLFYQNLMPDEAAAEAARAVEAAPENAMAWHSLGNAFFYQGWIRQAVEAFSEARRLAPHDALIFSRWLFSLTHDPEVTAEELVSAHQEYDRLFARALAAPEPASPRSGKIRLGYVSADLCNHSVANFLLPVLQCHDTTRFEVWCYSTSTQTDELTHEARNLATGWRDCAGWTDEKMAEQIREDAIDVLIELGGHTSGNRLGVFARRPAPVQVQWFGYPLGTGVSAFDARLTDSRMDPPEERVPGDRERLVRLPVRQCFVPKEGLPPVNDLPALDNGHVTFGSFNSPAKLNERVIDTWIKVLQGVPGSRLLLGSMDSQEFSDRLQTCIGEQGLDPDRIEIVPKVPMQEYLRLHHRIDVLLDPFPYNGGTTTCYALMMGVPMVTLKGRYGSARLGYSLLAQLKLEELVADSVESYVSICKSLADDLDRLSSLRSSLRQRFNESPLGQPVALAKSLEEALTQLLEEKSCGRRNPVGQ